MIKAYLIGTRVQSNEQEAFTLEDKSCFGEKKLGKIEYSLIESLYLTSINKMQIFQNKKYIDEENLIKKIKKIDKKIETKFAVFKDLRKKGYIVKSALKFGSEFRVYEKGKKPSQEHAKWIVFTAKEYENINWHDFAAKNRIAHSTKKNLLIAIVDEEEQITYYEISWLKP